ncbi:MAG: flagellar hook-length control protein FliK [Nitrospirae bacterium]|nr:flagellar hook-length control protein FliK [Nitrospirota bacterium]
MQINIGSTSGAAQPGPRPQSRESNRSSADDRPDAGSSSGSTSTTKNDSSSTRPNRDTSAISQDSGPNRANTSPGGSSTAQVLADDSTSQRTDDATTGKDGGEQFNSILSKLLKVNTKKGSHNNDEAAELAGSTAAVAPINPQPTGITGVNPDGVESVSTGSGNNDILSLLGASSNAKADITTGISAPLPQPSTTIVPDTSGDEISSLLGAKQGPNTTADTSTPTSGTDNTAANTLTPGSASTAKDDLLSLLGTKQPPAETATPTDKLPADNLTADNLSQLDQAAAKSTATTAGTQNTVTADTKSAKIPAINISDILNPAAATPELTITPEMIASAMRGINTKTPGNNPQDMTIADINTARRAKFELTSKDSSAIINELSSDAKPSVSNMPEINLADSNGSQLSKHDSPKDIPNAFKEAVPDDSKQNDSSSGASLTLNTTAAHESVSKTTHAEAANTAAPADDKLAIGAPKTVDIDGNKFTILRKTDTSVEVKLEPEGMGKLDISVNVQKGVLNANITASDATSKGIIEKNLHEIVNALAKEGLSVGGFTVSLKDRGGSFKDGKNDNGTNKNSRQERQLQPIAATTGYVRSAYSIKDGISIFA